MRQWCVMDLLTGQDGKLVLTKVQAACFHLALFITVCWITWRKGDWNESMWSMYALTAVGHAVLDKGQAQLSSFKEKQLEVNATAGSNTPAK